MHQGGARMNSFILVLDVPELTKVILRHRTMA